MDRNFIFAILLSTLVIIVYSSPQYQKRFGRNVPQVETKKQYERPTASPSDGAPVRERTAQAPIENAGSTGKTREITAREATEEEFQIDRPDRAETITLENEDITVELSTRGGVLTAVVLKKYDGKTEGEPVQIVEEGQTWYDGSIETDGQVIPMASILFRPRTVTSTKAVLSATLSGGRTVERIFSLDSTGYVLKAETKLTGNWSDPILNFTWNGPVNETEIPFRMVKIWPLSMLMRDDTLAYDKAVYLGDGVRRTMVNGVEKTKPGGKRIYLNEDHGQKIEAKKPGTGADSFVGDLSWFAVRNKYFIAAAIPHENKRWSTESRYSFDGADKWFDYTISKRVSDGETSIDMYLGPISYEMLKDYGHDLTEAMELSFRFIRPLSILFLWLFKKLHTIISNWGLVIIAFSVIIKLAVYPLSKTSYDSMRKMSALQPQINELREKYKNNPQMLQKATMELYKKEGVNPFGGCLPMILQMPVFFALYPVVGRAFELRQAMFIPNWIEDLSRPDPFYILPVAMGVSMFFQSKTTMKDPNQKAMLYIMPVMMVFLFANFSAGLTLYWFLFNVMSYAQQKIHRS